MDDTPDKPWYQLNRPDTIDSPAMLIYPQRVGENIERMIAYAGGVERLRPHVKTHKMAQVIRMQLSIGIDKFKVATIAEAEMVAEAGGTDILVAYPLVGRKASRFAQLIAKYPEVRWSVLVDDPQAAERLSFELATANVSADALIDLDVGMGRTGIAPGPAALSLYKHLGRLPGLRQGGFHVYDGQCRHPDRAQRTAESDRAFEPVDALRQELAKLGLPCPRLVCGGTPTFPIHAAHEDRECSPGTCLFWDASYESKFKDLEFLNAAAILTRVVSKPMSNRLCFDVGYKSVSPDNPDPRLILLGIPDAKMVIHSEEHLTVETEQAGQFSVGEEVYALPWHVCPTIALYPFVHVLDDGDVVQRWPVTARDRELTI